MVELKLADRPLWPPAGGRHQRSTSDSAAFLHFAASDADSGWPGAATRRELHFADDSAATSAWQAPTPQLVDHRAATRPASGSSVAAASAGGVMPSDNRSRLRTSSMPPLVLTGIAAASAGDGYAHPAGPAREQPKQAARQPPPARLRPQRSLDSKRPPALDVHVSARPQPDTAQPEPTPGPAVSAAVKQDQQSSALSPREGSTRQTAKRPPARTDPFAMYACLLY